MDYTGKTGSFHLSWAKHNFVHSLLAQLGAELNDWSGENSGTPVSAQTCREWAKLLKENINHFKVMKVPDNTFRNGGRIDAPLVDGIPLEKELATGVTSSVIRTNALNAKLLGEDETRLNPKDIEIGPAPHDTKTWITDFSDFLENCGGCEQH